MSTTITVRQVSKPRSFDGNEGVLTLMQWFEKKELVFEIYGYPERSRVKFATCTFSDSALTWWNGHVKSLTLYSGKFDGLGEHERNDDGRIAPEGKNPKVGTRALESHHDRI